jgi:glycosyltransferase involved in cell wall biosynthesis
VHADVEHEDRADAFAGRRVAIVHEKFTVYAGSERVVGEMHRLWPDAPIFTSVCDPSTVGPVLAGADIRPVRWLTPLYRGGDHYAHLLPLLPFAHRSHDLRGFDVVVTSHHAFANLAACASRLTPGTTVVSYTHTPARWMWDASMRADEVGGPVGRAALAGFAAMQRGADRDAARRLAGIVANSGEVARRVARWWGRDAAVVAPPVDVDRFQADATIPREDFFLLAGRLVPYKRPEVAVAAARRAGVRLVVAGDGRSRRACEAVAGGSVEFVGTPDDTMLRDLYRRCRALVYPGREDFGIMLVEAQACGAPVIALGEGAALETVVDGVTGVHYAPEPDPVVALAAELRDFDASRFDHDAIAARARHYGPDRFRRELAAAAGAMLPR